MAAYWTSSYTDRQLYMKVSADLSVAQGTLAILKREQLDALNQLANGYEFRTNLLNNYRQGMQNQLIDVRQSRNMDFIRFLMPDELANLQEDALHPHLASLHRGENLAGLTLLNGDELEAINPGLANKPVFC